MFPIKFGFLVFLQRLTRLLVCSHSRSCLCMCYQAPWRLHSASESDAALPERCLSGVPTSQLRQVGFFPGLSHAGLDGVMILTFEFSKCSQVINNRRNATQNDASSIRWPSRSDFDSYCGLHLCCVAPGPSTTYVMSTAQKWCSEHTQNYYISQTWLTINSLAFTFKSYWRNTQL